MTGGNRGKDPADIPIWIIWVQCICFSILYAIWALHETIALRHICLAVGAIIGIYEIQRFRRFLFQKNAIPVWLLLALFIWMSVHLFYLSGSFAIQLNEFWTIWKRTALGVLFGVGMGLALGYSDLSLKNRRGLWILFYVGLLAPTIIYVIKFFLTNYGAERGWIIPEYLSLYKNLTPELTRHHLLKASYVCFCLPVLVITLRLLYGKIKVGQLISWSGFFYLLTIPAVLFVFYSENIKNGAVYSILFLFIFVVSIIRGSIYKRFQLQGLIASLFLMLVAGIVLTQTIRDNDSWLTFIADAKVAIATEKVTEWKYDGTHGYPNNEYGNIVSGSNYQRIAWGIEGISLILKNPLGYGLIEQSFGYLGKAVWPDSLLTQTHSGWIDLMLGVGLPGFILVVGAMLLAMRQLYGLEWQLSLPPWNSVAYYALFTLLIAWCTTEASQKVLFDLLIYWIAFGSGLSVGKKGQYLTRLKI